MEGRGKDAPAARNPGAASATTGRKPRGVLIALAAVVALAAGGGLGYNYLMEEDAGEAPVVPTKRKVVVSPSPEAPPANDGAIVPPAPESSGAELKPVESEGKIEPVAKAELAPPAPVVEPGPMKDPQVVEALDLLNLSMARKRTGRCVIDSLVRKVGDEVSRQPLVVIKAITDTEVIFTDAKGVEYEKKLK